MNWLELHLDLTENQIEWFENALVAAGALSVSLTDNADQPILEPPPNAFPLWSHTRMTALFPAEIDTDLIIGLLQEQVLELPAYRWKPLENRIWEREWLKHFRPQKIDDTFWVSNEPVDLPGVTTLLLDPGLAFGTGSHPTTALCLRWLAANTRKNIELIDYGCGSGILAIAALLMGVEKVHCLDIDPQALIATAANMERNGFGQERYHLYRSAEDLPESDILVANILAKPICDMASNLSKLVRRSGAICLSGILAEQADEVSRYYRLHFNNLEVAQLEDWVRISGIKSS